MIPAGKMRRMPRGNREPRITSLTEFKSQVAQVFMVHPLLPNETVKRFSIGGRVGLQGTLSILSPWTLDMVVFFCPLSELDPDYDLSFFTAEPTPLNTVATANPRTLEKVGQEAFTSMALTKFHEKYIWDDEQSVKGGGVLRSAYVWPYWGKSPWMTTATVGALAAADTPEEEQSFLDDYLNEQETYQDILAAYGASMPVERGGLEIVQWSRGKLYPIVRAPDGADDVVNQGQIIWNVGASVRKPFRATQPGVLVGFYVVRPVLVAGNQQASFTGELFGRHDWMVPPFDHMRLFRPVDTAHLLQYPQATETEVAVNLAHFYLHGESLTNVALTATTDHFNAHRSDAPSQMGTTEGDWLVMYPNSADYIDSLCLKATGAKKAAHLDCLLSIASPIVEA